MNRFGDIGLTLAILVIFSSYRAVDFASVFALTPYFEEVLIDINIPFL